MKSELLKDGLHQYSMHIYRTAVEGGFSEGRAKAEVAQILLKELSYFTMDMKLPLNSEAVNVIEKVLGRPMTEEEKYRLMINI